MCPSVVITTKCIRHVVNLMCIIIGWRKGGEEERKNKGGREEGEREGDREGGREQGRKGGRKEGVREGGREGGKKEGKGRAKDVNYLGIHRVCQTLLHQYMSKKHLPKLH